MKRKSLFFALLLCSSLSYGQSGASYVNIYDTRDEINTPATFSQQLHLDFKSPFKDTPVNIFSTTITIAPWHDGSAEVNQLNVSKKGIFYRESNPGYTGWEAWKKIAMFDASGNLHIGDESGIGEYGKKLYFGSNTCNLDDVYMARYNVAKDVTELRISIGDDEVDKFVVGNKHWNKPAEFNPYFVVTMDGKVGINSPNPTYELEVNGKIKTREILVTDTEWADFVFKKDYKLRSLDEVKSHIEKHACLPEIPTESEVNANGVDLAKMNVKLLQKVEELTLYIIQQEEKMREQEQRITKLENQK
ncbi:hypothetical protein OCV73_09470 [Barnesiella propionica]|uniref:hypothetical protein n=1 Tax=Barnesiella propionica TaxID=2981781 RepID=UPI0011CC450C|nr:hypothetical protein [Barnesiella propionica]MCU6769168.1 hypothetical protein [Barnesiella propionica]